MQSQSSGSAGLAGAAIHAGWLATGQGTAAVIALLAVGVLLYRDGSAQMIVARQYRQGRGAERRVETELEGLRQEGWFVRHDVLKERGGNIDHVVCGPNGAFTVETKLRRYETDDLRQARGHAAWLKDRLGERWVEAVLCLERRDREPFQHEGVWIVSRTQLVPWLRKQRGRAIEQNDARRALADGIRN